LLDSLWGLGFSTIGSLTFESAAYVARYVMKKVTGEAAADHYGDLLPEYVTMSRRPGIGKVFFERFASDIYPDDFIISNGHKVKPPRYYDSLYEIEEPEVMAGIREARSIAGFVKCDDRTLDRLSVREQVATAKLSLNRRSLDDGI